MFKLEVFACLLLLYVVPNSNPRDLLRRLADAVDSGVPYERLKQSPLMVEIDAYFSATDPEVVECPEMFDVVWPPDVASDHNAAR